MKTQLEVRSLPYTFGKPERQFYFSSAAVEVVRDAIAGHIFPISFFSVDQKVSRAAIEAVGLKKDGSHEGARYYYPDGVGPVSLPPESSSPNYEISNYIHLCRASDSPRRYVGLNVQSRCTLSFGMTGYLEDRLYDKIVELAGCTTDHSVRFREPLYAAHALVTGPERHAPVLLTLAELRRVLAERLEEISAESLIR